MIYSYYDENKIQEIKKIIENNNLTCCFIEEKINEDLNNSLDKTIRSSRSFVVLITEDLINSKFALKEIEFAISEAEKYGKIIFPIIVGDVLLPKLLDTYKKYYVLDKLKLEECFNNIIYDYKSIRNIDLYYDKLYEYDKIGDQDKILFTIIDILEIFFSVDILIENREIKILSLLNKFYEKYIYGFRDETGVIIAKKVFNLVNNKIYKEFINYADNNKFDDIVLLSYYLTVISKTYEIMYECVDVYTNGDNRYPIPDDIKISADKLYLYYKTFNVNIEYKNSEIKNIVLSVPNLVLFKGAYIQIDKNNLEKKDNKELTIVQKIANHINESNKLFEEIEDETFSFEFYSCLKMSYERLKNYSIITDCKSIASDCVEKIDNINEKLQRLEMNSNAKNGVKEEGLKALLGLKKDINDSYDVFISYKHEDFDIAEDLYRFLKSNMIDAFFDKETLPEIGNSEYYDAIMETLDKSKNFIVISSDIEYLNAYWVNTEMTTFMQEIREGRKNGNFMMIFTDDVYLDVLKSNKKNINIKFRSTEIFKYPDFKENLLSYIKKGE